MIMKKLLLMLLLGSNLISWSQTCKEIVGYYPNWQWYDRNKLVNPQTIDYAKYSVINYSFFAPQPDGSIKITDPWADKNLLLGPINWAVAPTGYDSSYDFGNPAYHQSGQKFSEICHTHGVKLLPSIGGWTLSDNFSAIAADPAKRQVFANQCVDLIEAFGFDGIDLDWEYPGFADHGGTVNDITNFTLLLQDIRTSINAYGQSISKPMLLTIAVSADPTKMDDVQWTQVGALVDKINLMSYDFFGAFDNFTNHNSPLFAPAQGNPDFNAHAAIQRLTTQYNIPSSKINLGMAFYGRSQTTSGTPNLFVNSTGSADLVTFSADEGTPLYFNILLKQNLFNTHWDNTAKVPYLTGNSGLNTFLSYDDEQSIGLKAMYVIDHNLGGAIIWEITGDYIETSPGSGVISSTPLVDTINNVFCNYTNSGSTAGLSEMSSFTAVYPNPSNGKLIIDNKTSSDLNADIVDMNGILVRQLKTILPGNSVLDETELKQGIYFVRILKDRDLLEIHKIIIQ